MNTDSTKKRKPRKRYCFRSREEAENAYFERDRETIHWRVVVNAIRGTNGTKIQWLKHNYTVREEKHTVHVAKIKRQHSPDALYFIESAVTNDGTENTHTSVHTYDELMEHARNHPYSQYDMVGRIVRDRPEFFTPHYEPTS